MILAFAGKKQSGKTTASNYITGHLLKKNNVVKDFGVDEKGRLNVFTNTQDEAGEEKEQWVRLDLTSRSQDYIQYASYNIWPFVRVFNFADPLKSICVDVLGLTEKQVYGSDDDKKSLTNYSWEDMPGVVTLLPPPEKKDKNIEGRLGDYYKKLEDGTIYHEAGQMTAREVMQFFGTEIFRKTNPNIWVDTCFKFIEQEQVPLSLIGDCRFVNEVEAIQKRGGKVIKLANQFVEQDEEDLHPSEVELDNYDKFDAVIENGHLDIIDGNDMILKELYEMKIL